ncbi:hypothetical protein M4D70_17345 [Brevibacillus borstelensis]|uniref:hypothetical protein n=1 Tax=Brevibacillus borstelensis TaxID=45462 RepID=UPI00203A87AF|nr:hypothetical protein [Brevibacillus borstelensis]MCM3623994.1 hypothetical protein [Brevibacillus borstelensis]
MRRKVDLHKQRNWLLAALRHLRGIKQMRPDWGRLYAHILARLAFVEMELEQMEKQKEA